MLSRKPKEKDLYGTWKILRCEYSHTLHESLVGTEFRVEEGGDLSWTLSPGAVEEGLPFFACETYEVKDEGTGSDFSLLRFYGPNVDRIDFKCEFEGGKLLLSYDHYFKLLCDKVTLGDCPDVPCPAFSLTNALQEGFFSDATITAKNGKKFAFHKAIVSCSMPDQKWSSILAQLSELSPELLEALLHYFYNSCLPKGLTEETASGLINVAKKMKLVKLVELCKEHIESTAVRSRINILLADLRQSVDHIITLVSGVKCLTFEDGSGQESCPIDPAKLCDAIKVTLKEMAIVALKFILLCEIYNKRKTEVTREERHAIIQAVKDSLPSFAEQVHTFLMKCHESLAGLRESHKKEIADSLIPEIEMAWEKANCVGNEADSAIAQLVNIADGEHRRRLHPKANIGFGLSTILRNAIHMKELMALKKLHEEATSSFVFLQQKRESYASMPKHEKIRIIGRAIDKMKAEIQDHVTSVEKFPAAVREKLMWKDWKQLFTGGTARVAWLLGKVSKHKDVLKPLIQLANELISQESFTQTVIELGLMDPIPTSPNDSTSSASLQPSSCSSMMGELTRKQENLHLNSATTPPPATESVLAKALSTLLTSGEYADMKFVLGANKPGDEQCLDRASCEQTVELQAHRVVVASRCDWFRRALLSGMKESINRKILIPDVNPELFELFLGYLYSGVVDTDNMMVDKLMDLLALADKYETETLKQMCEVSLYRRHISEDSVLELLCFADRYSASTLKRGTIDFLKVHQDLCETELFEELPQHLQQEVKEQIRFRASSGELMGDDMANDLASCNISGDEGREMGVFSNRDRLEKCIRDLREILGDSIPRSELMRVTIAADYDISRAINFLFAS